MVSHLAEQFWKLALQAKNFAGALPELGGLGKCASSNLCKRSSGPVTVGPRSKHGAVLF